MTALRLALAALTSMAAVASTHAQEAASYYKGKTVKFIVGYGVGGGFDAYARMLAPPLAKALEANVIVENQPGAGGIIAMNRVAAAKPDGLSLVIVDGTLAALGQFLGQENVRYDMLKLDHLGLIAESRFVWLVGANSAVKSLTDIMKGGRKVLWGATGLTGSAAFTCEALGIACHVIVGYKSSGEMILAMQRGEVDSNYLSDSSAYALVQSNQARAIAVAARTRSKLLPDVPTLFESATLDAGQQRLLDFRANLNDLGRILFTMTGTEPQHLAVLRAAVKKVLTDPDLVAEGARTGRVLEYQPPEIARQKTSSVLEGISADEKERIRHVALKKFLD